MKEHAQNAQVRKATRSREKRELEDKMQIGLHLRQLRLERNLTQEEVASQLSLNRTAYTHYESGVSLPDILTLFRLCDIYAMKPEEMIRLLTSANE